jgi:hypothetical protein
VLQSALQGGSRYGNIFLTAKPQRRRVHAERGVFVARFGCCADVPVIFVSSQAGVSRVNNT